MELLISLGGFLAHHVAMAFKDKAKLKLPT